MLALTVGFAVLVLFGLGALLGAPYLPTRRKQAQAALDLLKLKPGQTVLDLGSGDASFLIMAARKGIHGIGYEINPLLVLWSKLATLRYRRQVTIKWANFWTINWPEVDGVYVFLIGRYMGKLDRKLCQQLSKPTPVASYTFKIPGRRIIERKGGVYLYVYGDSKYC